MGVFVVINSLVRPSLSREFISGGRGEGELIRLIVGVSIG